jgi:hypothetical protein
MEHYRGDRETAQGESIKSKVVLVRRQEAEAKLAEASALPSRQN